MSINGKYHNSHANPRQTNVKISDAIPEPNNIIMHLVFKSVNYLGVATTIS